MATHSSTLPGESHGQRSLIDYRPWGHKESDTTEATQHRCMPEFFGWAFSPAACEPTATLDTLYTTRLVLDVHIAVPLDAQPNTLLSVHSPRIMHVCTVAHSHTPT